jgi:myo-inositol catabolism protein IolS
MRSGSIPRGLGLGCWELGGMGAAGPDAADSTRMIRRAGDLGVRHFDTAQGYGGGASEAILGAALKDRREEVCVASKTHAMGREDVKKAVEVSCRRMGTDYIDIFYIHWPKRGLDLRPMMEGLEEARSEGTIRFIGVSNFGIDHMQQAGEAGRIDCHQLCYNLLWRYPERDVIPYCRERGIEVITYSSIAQGLLSDKTRAPETFGPGDDRAKTLYYRGDVWPGLRPQIEQMQALACRMSTPLSTLALQWVLSRPGVHGSLVGARSEAQIRLNVEAAGGTLTNKVADELVALSDGAMRQIPDEGNIFLYHP